MSLAAGLLIAVQAASVEAAEATTNTVKGRAPSVSPSILPAAPMSANTATVDAMFSDEDGDADASTYQWLLDGMPIPGATSSSLSLNQQGIGGNMLSVRVAPKTNPAISDPAIGSPATSAQVLVGSSQLARFIHPDTIRRTYALANTHCLGLGARVATQAELLELKLDATTRSFGKGSVNNEMCTIHGWPLDGQCGDSAGANFLGSVYWTSTTNGPSAKYAVDMSRDSDPGNIGVIDGSELLVACIN